MHEKKLLQITKGDSLNDECTRPQVAALDIVPQLQRWAQELGFAQIGITHIDLQDAEAGLLNWLAEGFHGDMHYMQAHGLKRARPAELVPGTIRVISARMDYLPASLMPDWREQEWQKLADAEQAVISLYARGRDYHKVLRGRLQKLATQLAQLIHPLGYRVFTDSAPVLEVELASRSGLGWRGKHSLLLSRQAGSMFFLGEIFIDYPLPVSSPEQAHCGSCQACIAVCPTQAIIGPGLVDARRCIAYLTIEHSGAIPIELRPLIGNRIYGCDDCQLICPWNKFAGRTPLADFETREVWQRPALLDLWQWDEARFLQVTAGSPIRRIGYERWQRNVAVALGNSLQTGGANSLQIKQALQAKLASVSPMVAEHITWALAQGELSGQA